MVSAISILKEFKGMAREQSVKLEHCISVRIGHPDRLVWQMRSTWRESRLNQRARELGKKARTELWSCDSGKNLGRFKFDENAVKPGSHLWNWITRINWHENYNRSKNRGILEKPHTRKRNISCAPVLALISEWKSAWDKHRDKHKNAAVLRMRLSLRAWLHRGKIVVRYSFTYHKSGKHRTLHFWESN